MLAGTNGVGKSSMGSQTVRASGSEYFNLDEVAQALRRMGPATPTSEANLLAWNLPKRNVARVTEHVKHAGHDIPQDKIREAYWWGLTNLVHLLGGVDEAQVFDNSAEADRIPELRLVLPLQDHNLVYPATPADLQKTPEWARPLLAAALQRDDTLMRRFSIPNPSATPHGLL